MSNHVRAAGSEVSIDIDLPESGYDKKLTDIDRGLILLSKKVFGENGDYTQNSIHQLITLHEEQTKRVSKLKKSERHWSNIESCSTRIAIACGILSVGAEAVDQLIDSEQKSDRNAKVAVVLTIAGIGLIALVVTSTLQYYIGKQYRKRKQLAKISEQDTETVKKIKTILESLGRMERAIQNHDEDVDSRMDEEKCFKTIRKLEEREISDKELPNKAQLASVVISTLPPDHPIKKELDEIQKLTPREGSSSGGAFQDVGQKAGTRHSPPKFPSGIGPEDELSQKWSNLRNLMHGLYVDQIFCDDGTCLGNCTSKNPHYH